MDAERTSDVRASSVPDSGFSGQREGDVHGCGLQVCRVLRVQIRIHDCRGRDQVKDTPHFLKRVIPGLFLFILGLFQKTLKIL